MKKAVIIILSIAMVLMLSGFAFVAAGGFTLMPNNLSSSGGKYEQLTEKDTTQKSVDAQSCKTIELDTVNSNIEVIKYDGSDIKLEYESIYKNEWSYSFSGSKMKLENKKYSGFFEGLRSFYGFLEQLKNGGFDFSDIGSSMMHSVKLYIPSSASPQININNVNGSAGLNGISAKSMSFNLVNSSLDISDTASTGNVNIIDVNGQINIKNLKAPLLNLPNVTNGQCNVDTPQFDEIDAKSFVNASLSLIGVTDPEDYSVSYNMVNGGAKIGGDSFNGSGSHSGSGVSKYKVNFNGVNGNLYIGE